MNAPTAGGDMDDILTGAALKAHLAHCRGCDECRRSLSATESRDFLDHLREGQRLEDRYFGKDTSK